MNDCGSCVHWQNPWVDAYLHIGKVPREEHPRWGTCQKITLPDAFGTVDADVVAFTQDGSDYTADLHVRSDFGCKLWEAKP